MMLFLPMYFLTRRSLHLLHNYRIPGNRMWNRINKLFYLIAKISYNFRPKNIKRDSNFLGQNIYPYMSFKRAARLCSWGWVIGLSLASISPALSFYRPLPIHATPSSPGTTEQKNKDFPSREQEWIVVVDKLANILFDHEQ